MKIPDFKDVFQVPPKTARKCVGVVGQQHFRFA